MSYEEDVIHFDCSTPLRCNTTLGPQTCYCCPRVERTMYRCWLTEKGCEDYCIYSTMAPNGLVPLGTETP